MPNKPTIVIHTARPGVRRVRIDTQTYPVGEPLQNVPDTTLHRLQELPGVTVTVTAPGTGDDPDPATEEG